MPSQNMTTSTVWHSARAVATELLREPVKEAVRDALREETTAIKSESDETNAASGEKQAHHSQEEEQKGGQKNSQQSSQGGRSKLAMAGVVLAIVGVTYLARRRMSSTTGSAWSEPSPGAVADDDAEDGYVSEGEMQTAETADQNESGSEGTSPSPATDQ